MVIQTGGIFTDEECSVNRRRTSDELSVVCTQALVPSSVRREDGWRCLKVAGPWDFSLVAVIASLTGTLAAANISVFVLSTFDTDYLLVKQDGLDRAIETLTTAGHRVRGRQTQGFWGPRPERVREM